eukprot:675844-Amphidinium_carterae.2
MRYDKGNIKLPCLQFPSARECFKYVLWNRSYIELGIDGTKCALRCETNDVANHFTVDGTTSHAEDMHITHRANQGRGVHVCKESGELRRTPSAALIPGESATSKSCA